MKTIRKKVCCANCQHEFETDRVVSAYRPDASLDGKPVSAGLLPRIEECPKCHFRSFDIERKQQDDLEQARFLLAECWESEYAGDDAAARKKRVAAVEAFERSFAKQAKAGDIIVYLDCRRQLGDFDIAKKAAKEADGAFRENLRETDNLMRIYQFEKSLIDSGDAGQHLVSEVL